VHKARAKSSHSRETLSVWLTIGEKFPQEALPESVQENYPPEYNSDGTMQDKSPSESITSKLLFPFKQVF
jgi:hypothetical protein